jgi:glycosyltransferase involved in cell wall biosynthesis
MKNLHITFLSQLPVRPNCGGIERVTHLLAQEFSNNNISVSFVYTHLPESATYFPENNQTYLPYDEFDSFSKFEKFLRNNGVDLVINQFMSPSICPFLKAAKTAGIKVVTVLHNRPFGYIGFERKAKQLTSAISLSSKIFKYIGILTPQFYGFLMKSYTRRNYIKITALSDKLYLLSDRFIPRILKYAPRLPKNKLDAINNPNTFSLTDTFVEKEKLVIWVGRLSDPQKNGIDFMRVWKIFHQLHPEWKAIMLGEGPERIKYENFIKKNHIKNLSMLGNRKDIQSFYARAQFLCMTSLYEGWPMVLPECMAYECIPVVFDTFESIHDLITNRRSGLIIPPFNCNAMAQEMSNILDDSSKLFAMQKSAKNAIVDFTPEKIGSIWYEKIFKLIN